MNPIDAPPEDWPLYYSGTWMMHSRYGAGYVDTQTNIEGEVELKFYNDKSKGRVVQGKDLTLYFPEAGAYNTRRGGFVLFRRAQRSMRKSASYPNTYYTAVGYAFGSTEILNAIIDKHYYAWRKARLLLKSRRMSAVALSLNVLVDKNGVIYYRGRPVADIGFNKEDKAQITPESTLPLFKIKSYLRKEGIPV